VVEAGATLVGAASAASTRQVSNLEEETGLQGPAVILGIAVGLWGTGSEDSKSLLLAGADRVGTTMNETRDQMIQLCQIGLDSEASSITTVPAYPHPAYPEVVA